jgi:translation initiation factor 2 subunit 2
MLPNCNAQLTRSVADPEVDLFAGMKKKKKKVVDADTEEATPEPEKVAAPPVEGTKAAPLESSGNNQTLTVDAPVEEDKPAEDAGDMFADLKKKKKKKKEIPMDLVGCGTCPSRWISCDNPC